MQRDEVAKVPSLRWVLLDGLLHYVDFLGRREMFDRDKNFCPLVRAKGVAYVNWQ